MYIVMDKITINEQNKSIAIGLLYLQPEFEAIGLLLPGVMTGSCPWGIGRCNTGIEQVHPQKFLQWRNGAV